MITTDRDEAPSPRRRGLFTLALALLLAAACTLGVAHAAGSANEDPALVHARALLAKATLFDGHNDLPWAIRDDKTAHGMVSKYDLRTRAPGQTDIPRLRAGGVQAQFWSVYIPGEQQDGHFARTELEQIAIAREIIRTHGDVFTLASPADDVRKARKAGIGLFSLPFLAARHHRRIHTALAQHWA